MIESRHIVYLALLCACTGARPTEPVQSAGSPASSTIAEEETWTLRAGEQPRVFRDELDRKATLVPVKSTTRATGAYLVQVDGYDDDIDGLVFLTTRRSYGPTSGQSGNYYELTLRGEPTTLLSNSARNGWHMYDFANTYRLEHDASAKVDGAALLALHRQQTLSGKLSEFAPADRAGRIVWQDRLLQRRMRYLVENCETRVSIDWASVDDEWFDTLGVELTCQRHMVALIDFCKNYPHAVDVLQQLGGVRCSFAGHPDTAQGLLRKDKGALTIVPGKRGATRRDIYPHVMRDLSEILEIDPLVLRDEQRYIVIKKKAGSGSEHVIYVGSKDALYPQSISFQGSRQGILSWDLWAAETVGTLKGDNGNWSVQCDDRNQPLTLVTGPERRDILKTAKFESESLWKHSAYYLGRDSNGVYYYVDVLRDEFGGQGHRVFVGRRGQVEITKLVRLVEDSKGMLFSTKRGKLRLSVHQTSQGRIASWKQGKTSQALITVPLAKNRKLIYQSLGAYFGEAFGDICE